MRGPNYDVSMILFELIIWYVSVDQVVFEKTSKIRSTVKDDRDLLVTSFECWYPTLKRWMLVTK